MSTRTVVSVALCALAGLVSSANAVGLDVKGDVSATVASSYVWRGLEINDEAVIQPQVTLNIERWALAAWGTWDLKSDPETSVRTRVDVQADYGMEWKNLLLKAGAVVRAYHDDPGRRASDTYEVYAQAAASDMSFYPSVTMYYDFGTIDGLYVSLAAGETWELYDWMDMVFDVRLGVASDGFVQRFFAGPPAADGTKSSDLRGGLVDFSSSLALPIVQKALVITPKVEYSTVIDSVLKEVVEAAGRNSDSVSVSLTVSWAF